MAVADLELIFAIRGRPAEKSRESTCWKNQIMQQRSSVARARAFRGAPSSHRSDHDGERQYGRRNERDRDPVHREEVGGSTARGC
jgi:hypothetical protein